MGVETTEVQNTYTADAISDGLLAASMAIEDIYSGRFENFQFVEALGLVGGIWPASVEPEEERQCRA